MLSALGAVGGSINKLPCNGGITKTKGGRQIGSAHDVLVAIILRFRCSDIQSNAASIVCNLGSNWLDCVAVYYWCRFVLNIDVLSTGLFVASTIGKFPCNSGITDTKGGWQNGGTCDVLVAVVLRFWCGKGQCDAASVIGNLGSDWINLRTVYYWRRLV